MLENQCFDSSPQVRTKRKQPKLPENPEAASKDRAVGLGRFPSWLHRKLPKGGDLWKTNTILRDNALNTVCEECKCPNRLECFTKKTATYLVAGRECTRACGFCDIDFAKAPKPLEDDEPQRLVDSVKQLGLEHVVITMVTRDDLEDGASGHIAKIIQTLRDELPHVTIEVLTSDFSGKQHAWDTVLAARPEIFNHNIETVERLSPKVRHKATYRRSLELLSYAREHGQEGLLTKAGIMVGLGETEEEVQQTIRDLKAAGCDMVTIGQYLQPNRHKLPVRSFVTPEQFEAYAEFGRSIGIQEMYCGPFVRSSYNAGAIMDKIRRPSQ